MKFSKLSTAILLAISSTQALSTETKLEQLVVTANNTTQTLHSVTSNTIVITKEDIETKQYQTMTDALKNVAGIVIKDSGGLGKATSFFMRGDATGHILVLLDGVDLTDAAGTGGAHIETISLSNVERIEIIKGAQSGVWGANATAGVINIITKSSGHHAQVNLEVGSHGSKKIATTLGAANEKIDFSINLSSFTTNGYSAVRAVNTAHEKFEKDGYSETDVSFKLGINLAKNHRLQTYIKNQTGQNEFDGTTGAPSYLPAPDDTVATNSYSQTIKKLDYLYSNDALSAKLYISDHQLDNSYPIYFSEYKGNIRELGAQVGYRYNQTDNLSLLASKKTLDNTDTTYENNGFALTNTNQFNNKKLILTQSIRHDQFDKFENATTGKLGIKNYFTNQFFISANYATAYNAPLLSQLSRPNPSELVPEKTQSYDLSIGLNGFELSYFHSQTDDLIEYVYQPWPTPYYYKNADKEVIFEGIEASYSQNLNAIDTDININATWLSAKNEDGKFLSYRPENTAAINLDYHGFSKTHLALETRYTGTQYSADDKQGVQLGEYFVTDIKANYTISPTLRLYGRITNLFDDNYTTSITSSTGTNANYVYSNGGRQFFIGVQGKM